VKQGEPPNTPLKIRWMVASDWSPDNNTRQYQLHRHSPYHISKNNLYSNSNKCNKQLGGSKSQVQVLSDLPQFVKGSQKHTTKTRHSGKRFNLLKQRANGPYANGPCTGSSDLWQFASYQRVQCHPPLMSKSTVSNKSFVHQALAHGANTGRTG
jgi:hypothetical protein